jgi:hypothetical protein
MAKQVEDLEAMLRTLKTEMGVNNDDGTNKNTGLPDKIPPMDCRARNTAPHQQTFPAMGDC